jgi:hypothetical protein
MAGIEDSTSASASALAIIQLMTDVAYSTTIGKKTYDGAVTYSGGEYVAAASSPSDAEAAGGSVQAAESNLTTRIDILA